MPAILREGTFLGWSDERGPRRRQREREERSYAWSTAEEGLRWALPRSDPPDEIGRPSTAEGATLVHDLRHLLTRMSLEVELAGPEAVQVLLARARALCDEVLGGEPDVRLDLALLCREEADAAAALVPGRKVLLALPESLAWAGAPSAARRLVSNLLLNALHVTPEGARVELRLVRSPDGGALLRVIDEGPGFARDSVDGSLATRRSGRGSTGLGSLSIQRCAQRLRATVVVSSAPGAGTEFQVRLPA